MTFFENLAATLGRFVENAGRSRARRELLMRGDRALADAGFSRALLESGNDAWPWRIESGEPVAAPARPATPSRIVASALVPMPIAAANVGRDGWREEMRDVA